MLSEVCGSKTLHCALQTISRRNVSTAKVRSADMQDLREAIFEEGSSSGAHDQGSQCEALIWLMIVEISSL